MAIDFKQLFNVAEFARGLGNYAQKPPQPAPAPATSAEPALAREEQAMFKLKASLLKEARDVAIARGDRPSLEDYRTACERFESTEQGQAMVASGQWKPAIYADLSGQNLDGFRITEPKAVKPNQPVSAQVQADYDSLDRDGDGQINVPAVTSFYDNISFDKASLRGAFVEPATSFNEEVAKAKQLAGLTFSGMGEGDTFTFRAGAQYKDIRLENVNGGHIDFNGSVDGISISGKSASIGIGAHAQVNALKTAEGFSVVHLEMATGAVLSNSDLSKSTISMTSHFEAGSAFQNVHLSSNVDGLDLSGVRLTNVSVDGKAITHPSQLPEGVTYDARTTASASPEFIMQCAAAQAVRMGGVQDFSWKPEMREPSPAIASAQTAPLVPPAVTTVAEAPAAPQGDPLAAIRATMEAQISTIGKPLTQQEQANLLALNEAREQQRDAAPSLPRRS